MTRVLLSRMAEQDVEEIGRYTQREWGKAQRRSYIAGIAARCALLSRTPHMGAIRDNVRPGASAAFAPDGTSFSID